MQVKMTFPKTFFFLMYLTKYSRTTDQSIITIMFLFRKFLFYKLKCPHDVASINTEEINVTEV